MADLTTDTPGAAPRDSGLATYNLTVSLPSMQAARQAVEALDWAGVANSDITLGGSLAAQAVTATDTAAADGRLGASAARATLGGAAIGSALGAAVGLLAGGATFGLTSMDPALGAGLWATTLGGTAAGGGVGFTTGAMATMKQSQAWELTLHDVGEGHVSVEVHTEDPRELDKATKALHRRGFGSLHVFDRDGNDTAVPRARGPRKAHGPRRRGRARAGR